jgi:TctA family transporter
MIGLWVRLLRVRYAYMFPAILLLCAIGAYSINSSVTDVFTLAIFGVLGYLFRKLDCPAVPLLLGFVLGDRLEEEARRALLMSDGDWMTFVDRPLSLAFLLVTVLLATIVILPGVRAKRDTALAGDDL